MKALGQSLSIFVGIDETASGYVIFVPRKRSLLTSVDVIFDELFLLSFAFKFELIEKQFNLAPLVMPH